jgi:hypothetical protein
VRKREVVDDSTMALRAAGLPGAVDMHTSDLDDGVLVGQVNTWVMAANGYGVSLRVRHDAWIGPDGRLGTAVDHEIAVVGAVSAVSRFDVVYLPEVTGWTDAYERVGDMESIRSLWDKIVELPRYRGKGV